MEKRNGKVRGKKDRDERNHNRMRSSEGWRFGGRANENARDWLWEELVAWAAKSISFICFPWSWYRWHTPPPWLTLQRPADDTGSGSRRSTTGWEAKTGGTYVEFLAGRKLAHDFFSDLVVRDAQVLPDVTIVAHQGHVVLGDVEQLWERRVKHTIPSNQGPETDPGGSRCVRSWSGENPPSGSLPEHQGVS